MSGISFQFFPRTEPPPDFAARIVAAFEAHYETISTVNLPKGLTSDQVLAAIRPDQAHSANHNDLRGLSPSGLAFMRQTFAARCRDQQGRTPG